MNNPLHAPFTFGDSIHWPDDPFLPVDIPVWPINPEPLDVIEAGTIRTHDGELMSYTLTGPAK